MPQYRPVPDDEAFAMGELWARAESATHQYSRAQYEAVADQEPPAHEGLIPGETASAPNDRPISNATDEAFGVCISPPRDENGQQEVPKQNDLNRCVHRGVLVGMVAFFGSCCLTVGLLYHFSLMENGLTNEEQTRRYTWIYGPTAVVVLLRMLWRVIDLKVKETMPWHELAYGPASARRTITLEYFSRTIFGNTWETLKLRHWAAATTILGYLVLLSMIVFATGLFVLEGTLVSNHGVPFIQNQFNGSGYNASVIQASPVLLDYAIRVQNLSFPQGTTSDTIVPLFEPIDIFPEDSIYEAIVDGVNPSMTCETLDITNATREVLPWIDGISPHFLIDLDEPDCKIKNIKVGYLNHRLNANETATQTFQGEMSDYTCNTAYDYSKPPDYRSAPQVPGAYEDTQNRGKQKRIIISVVDLRARSDHWEVLWLHNITVLSCKPSYFVNKYRVQYYQNSTGSSIELLSKTDNALDGVYPGDLARGVGHMFTQYGVLVPSFGEGGSDVPVGGVVPPFHQMLKRLKDGDGTGFSLKDLMDPVVLKSLAEPVLVSTAVQLLRQYFMTDLATHQSNVATEGTTSFVTSRLHVKPVSTGFLCAGFLVLTIFSAILICIAPQSSRSRHSLGSSSIVLDALQTSPDFAKNLILRPGSDVESTLRELKYARYESNSESLLCVSELKISETSTDSITSSKHESTEELSLSANLGWQPASAKWWFTILAATIPLAIIGVLEAIQHASDRHRGFVDVRSIDMGTTVLAQYVPAAVALGVNLIFGSIEQVVAATAPFLSLRHKDGAAPRVLGLDYRTKSGPHAFVLSIFNKHIGLSIILVTTFVASFLSIVIPGLYNTVSVESVGNVIVLQLDKFDPSSIDISVDDKGAGIVFNHLTYFDLPYPDWVFEDLALPQYAVPNVPTKSSRDSKTTSDTLSLRTEAIRAKLQCVPVTNRSDWIVEPAHHDAVESYREYVEIRSTVTLPWSLCSHAPLNVTAGSAAIWNQSITADRNTGPGDTIRVGQANAIDWNVARSGGAWIPTAEQDISKSLDSFNTYYIAPPRELSDWGCPTIAFTIGTIDIEADPSNTTRGIDTQDGLFDPWTWKDLIAKTDITTVICSQTVESVETDITLQYPDLSLSLEEPPRPDESTIRWLEKNGPIAPSTVFEFVPRYLFRGLNDPSGPLGAQSEPWTVKDDVDRFTQALLHVAQNEDNMTLQDLFGETNRLNVEKMVQKMYGRYMALVFSNMARVDVEQATPNLTLRDSAWNPLDHDGASRLKPRSTRSRRSSKSLQPRDSPRPNIPAVLKQTGASGQTKMVQNKGPKIALQVMLGVMAAGAILTKMLHRMEDLLPHEPYSIAGRAILMANGNVLLQNRQYAIIAHEDQTEDVSVASSRASHSSGTPGRTDEGRMHANSRTASLISIVSGNDDQREGRNYAEVNNEAIEASNGRAMEAGNDTANYATANDNIAGSDMNRGPDSISIELASLANTAVGHPESAMTSNETRLAGTMQSARVSAEHIEPLVSNNDATGMSVGASFTDVEKGKQEQRYKLGWWKDSSGIERYGIYIRE